MNFQDYQTRAMQTALPSALNLTYMIANLAAEAGEVAGVYAKACRDGWSAEDFAERMVGELGDVCWMVAGVCEVLGLSLEEVAEANLAKLADRQARGTISGSGDLR